MYPPPVAWNLPCVPIGCQTDTHKKRKGAETPFPCSLEFWWSGHRFADRLFLGCNLRLTPGDHLADRRAGELPPCDAEPQDRHDHQQAAGIADELFVRRLDADEEEHNRA